jgi:pilus assembly protein Flp/PilA
MIASNAVKIRKLVTRLARNNSGATAIEYGLIAAMIAVVCIGAFKLLGNSSSGSWGNMASTVITAMQK